MNFQDLHYRLITHLKDRVRSGELTERGLARMTGVSQPHIHNVLKGKRTFSTEISDVVLFFLKLDLLDLIDPDELARWKSRK
jgi:predicted transcriptional regulator